MYRTCPRCLKESYKRGWCYNCFYERGKDGRKSLPPKTKPRAENEVERANAKMD